MNNLSDSQFFRAQFGEDRILSELFQGKTKGLCIEVGGYDGLEGSNTYFFERLGWDCVLVEPVPEFYDRIRKNRGCRVINLAASSESGTLQFFVAKNAETLSTSDLSQLQQDRIRAEGGELKEIKVKKETLNTIFEKEGISGPIDFITIDVEGHELEVLQGLDLARFQPRILIIEDVWNGAEPKLHRYLNQRGYFCFKRTGCNDWFGRLSDPLVSRSAIAELKRWRFRQETIKKSLNVPPLRWIKKKLPNVLKTRIKKFLGV